jgi:extradiol dioxygenase family protein
MKPNALNPNSLRQRIIRLRVGQSLFIAAEDYNESTARYYASQLGFKYGRTYKTHINRDKGGYQISREA